MTLIKSETRETYTSLPPRWDLTPAPPARRSRPDQVDLLFLDLQTGTIDMRAAAHRVRELIGAAEVASANEALHSWVFDDGQDDDGYRCPYCHRRECSH